MFSVNFIAFCTGITLIFSLTSKFNIKVFIAQIQEAVPTFLENISTSFILIYI